MWSVLIITACMLAWKCLPNGYDQGTCQSVGIPGALGSLPFAYLSCIKTCSFENIVPANIRKQKYPYYYHFRQQCHPFVAVSGMRTDTAYGRARLPYPRRFAVLVTVYMQAGVIRVYPGWFWRWPVAALRLRLGAYASAA